MDRAGRQVRGRARAPQQEDRRQPPHPAARDAPRGGGAIVYGDPNVGTFSIADTPLNPERSASPVPAFVELGKDASVVDQVTGESSAQFTSSGSVGVRAGNPTKRDNAFQITAMVDCGFDATVIVDLTDRPGTYDLEAEHARMCVKDFASLEQDQFCQGHLSTYVGPANVGTCLPIAGSLELTQSAEQC